MSVQPRIDASEMDEVARDLGRATAKVAAGAYAVVKKGAQNIKTDWANQWTGMRALQHLPREISYDIGVGSALRGQIEATIGPVARGQGNLGHIVEHGSSRQPPIRPVTEAVLRSEAPKFEKALGDLGEAALGDGPGLL